MPRRGVREETRRGPCFAEVARLHLQAIYGFMIGSVGDPETARDLTQQTFVKAAASWGRYDRCKGTPERWLYGIARHVRDDHFRSSEQQKVLHNKIGHNLRSDASEGAVALMDADLGRAFSQLVQAERDLLWWCVVLEIPIAEVARSLGIKRSTCSMRLMRALEKVRNLMGLVTDA